MKKLLFIINPKAGVKKNKHFVDDALEIFEKAGYKVGVKYTKKRADGTRIARDYGAKADLIVCMGGDGTLNEVMQGMLEGEISTPLGYIPAGSTNDFANRLGHFAYVLHGIREVFKIRRLKLRIETEDEVYENKYIFVAINNAKKVGGIMRLDKAHVEFNDGEFELMLVEFPKDFIQLMKTVGKIFMQDFSGNITFKQIKSAKITNCSDVNWSLDGEKEKAHDFVEFKVIHNAINFIY